MLNTAIVCHGAVVIMWWSWKCILRYTAVVIGTALLVNYSCLRKRKFDKEKEFKFLLDIMWCSLIL